MQGIVDTKQRRFALPSNLTRLAVSDLDQDLSLLPTTRCYQIGYRNASLLLAQIWLPELRWQCAARWQEHLCWRPM